MRRILALCLLLASAIGVWAAPVVVTSGEHRDFTRIVVQFEGPVDWQFGRTLDGYALRVPGQALDYDLSRAFELIGRTRVAGMKRDPANGDLAVGIACPCYAMPFEFRPGIVVIDLYDGAAPPGSSFEVALPQISDAPALVVPEATAPEPAVVAELAPDAETLVEGYDWTRLSLEQMGIDLGEPASMGQNLPDSPVTEALQPDIDRLRDGLVQELGAGATAGLIDLAPPPKSEEPMMTSTSEAGLPEPEKSPGPDQDATGAEPDETTMRTHLGETPQIQMRDVGERGPALTADGEKCYSEEELDLASWGAADRAVSDQFGPVRQGMVGEFDKPSAEAVKRVVRFYLFVGFGAEARATLRAYPDLFEEAPVWTAMAHLLDNEEDPAGVFAGMEDCDTPAALWAVLTDPESLPKDEIGRAAVARSFSALPATLRRVLGPRVVEAFLDAGDLAAATALSEAVLRAPGDPGPEVVRMEAAMARAQGHVGEAEAKLEPLAAAPGPSATDALVDLVEHRATLGQRVSQEEVLTLEAALKEREGSPEEARYRTALVLAKAASGQYDAAFAEADDPETLSSIWRLLAQAGGDTPLLTHATLAEGQAAPEEARASAGIIADRMLTLGLADQASRWLDLAPQVPAMLRARVALANGRAQEAIDLVKDDTSERALNLTAQALIELGDQEGAALIYEQLGKAEQQLSLMTSTEAWEELAKDGPDTWKNVAGIVAGTEAEAPVDPLVIDGPLAQNKRLLDESVTTRDAITNLLNSVQVPGQVLAPPSQ